jgi:very-short-patch-repair endonuclease
MRQNREDADRLFHIHYLTSVMNNKPRSDPLLDEILQFRNTAIAEGDADPFILPTSGSKGIVRKALAQRFPNMDEAFGATISMSLQSEFSVRVERLNEAVASCESPIEARFLLALICACAKHQLTISVQNHDRLEIYGCEGVHGDTMLTVRCQHSIGHHRVDFALDFTFIDPAHIVAALAGKPAPQTHSEKVSEMLVVECDGHAFHEKTPEQARRDKSRDRELLIKGYPVMRFTGSEIHQRPLHCAEQVIHEFLGINKLPDEMEE